MIAEFINAYSQTHPGDTRNVRQPVDKILQSFGDRVADQIKPTEIDEWLTANSKTPATAN